MDKIFKAYDIRGVYPEDINAEISFRIGRAFASYLNVSTICVGRDMRVSSEELAQGLIAGIRKQGVNVVDLGLTSTDMVYFATGKFGYGGGVMITASHNPGQWNGFKMCRENALPISSDNGLPEIKTMAIENKFKEIEKNGDYEKKNILTDWICFASAFIDFEKLKDFKIAVDAGNGMAGMIFPEVSKKLDNLKIVPMYFELDGTFPNHLASPIEAENTLDLRKKVVSEGCDFGLAFDGDADRVFFIDDKGEVVSGTVTTAMIAEAILERNPGAKIIYNAICGKIVPEVISRYQGVAIKERVGHSLIKDRMQKEGSLFAGEHSGHYYFKENFNADSALIATFFVLDLLSKKNKKLSELVKDYSKYFASGEINSKVEDIPKKLSEIKKKYSDAEKIDELDGISFYYSDFWFNVRPSNTEPLLRLNLEANNQELLERKTEELLLFIRR